MGNVKITDLVDPQALQDLETLNKGLEEAKKNYSDAAKEMAQGLKMKIDGLDDLAKFEEIVEKGTKKADDASEQYNETAKKQQKIVEQTTNTISRELGEIEKENKAKREAYKINKDAMKIAKDILGSRSANVRQLATITADLKKNAAEQKKLNDAEKDGSMSTEELINRRAKLIDEEQNLKAAKAELNKILNNEVKMNQAAEGSYTKLSLQLELMKKAYKDLNDEEKNGEFGKVLGEEIGKLDAHLKDLSSDMGEFQRNVGNYAIAQGDHADTIKEKLFGIIGISEQTGNSIISLGQKGSGGFAALKVSASSFFKTLMGFLANPAVIALLGIGGTVMAFKWIYDYNKGIAEATRLTQQFTGASGDALKNQRVEVQALADTYGKDFQEVLIATNALAKQYGISFDEAFRHVKDGFVSGADANGEFLDNVKEYPAYFKEAGISARQFIAITTQANKEGIYSDKGIDVIKEGNLRIREMTQATADALEGIGISSKEVLKGLEEGSLTTFDVMQMVSKKLEEYPESSAAVGTAIADIFGGPGEDAGLQYIKTLHKISTNLDEVKSKAGRLAELQEEQLEAEMDMQNHLAALFDLTGGSFEELTTAAKTFVKNGVSKIIDGVIGLYNYFVELYNSSDAFRLLWNEIIASFKSGFDFIGNLFNAFVDILKATGTVLKAVFTLDWDTFKQGLQQYADAVIDMAKTTAKDFDENFAEAIGKTQNKLKPITVPVKPKVEGNVDTPVTTGGGGKGTKGLTAQEAAKQAEERKKIIEALKQSELDLMDEGFAKEMAKMAENHRKRLETIKGHSAEENQLRANYDAMFLRDKQKYEDAYNEQRRRVELEYNIAVAKEGSDEKLSLLLEQLDLEYQSEIRNAEKTGTDISVITAKYNLQKETLEEEYAMKRNNLLQEQYAVDEILMSNSLKSQEAKLAQQYAQGLISKEEYERQKAELEERYSLQSSDKAISLIEQQLKEENISAEERERLEIELAKAKAEQEKLMADNMIASTERQKKADADITRKRIDNLNKISEALDNVNQMGNMIFDVKLSKLEEEQEANQDAHDAEIERIEHLAEIGAISQEEAERRKIAAENKTKQKEEQIAKEKQKLQHKQAVWNKANQIAQTGIATARAIMEAWAAGFPMGPILAAAAAAMGAVQIAAIIATPIPKYAKGTDSHPGGLAVVGDGGKEETVVFGNSYWTTPDRPTLVNLPKGAEVYPDAGLFENLHVQNNTSLQEFGKNSFALDYEELQKGHRGTERLLGKILIQQRRNSHNREYELFKHTVL